MAPKAKKIYKNVKKQEKKIAKKEVKKAKKMIHKNHKWTVAASALGYHAGFSSHKGFIGGKGGLTEKLQGGVVAKQVPASSSIIFTPYYTRKTVKNGLIVCGLQKIAQVCVSNANTTWCLNLNGTKVAFIRLNPDNIGGQMAFDARNYQYFRFKKIKFIFIQPSSAGSADSAVFTNVSISVGHFNDPEIGAFQTINYDSLQNCNDMFEFQVVQPFGPLTWKPKQLGTGQVKWYNTEMDTAPSDAGSRAESRLCCQGVIYGFYDQAMAGASGTLTKVGDMLMEYELELKERSPDYGFTFQIGDRQLLKDVETTILKRVESDKKDTKSKEDEKEPNIYMKKYYSTMLALKRLLRSEVKTQIGGNPVMLCDPTWNGSDSTKIATVGGGQLACSATAGGVGDVNVVQVAGNTLSSSIPVTTQNEINVALTKVGSSAIDSNAADGGLLPVTITNGPSVGPSSGSYASVVNSAVALDLAKVGGATVLKNSDNDFLQAGTVPVSIGGYDNSSTFNVAQVFGGGDPPSSKLAAANGVQTTTINVPDVKNGLSSNLVDTTTANKVGSQNTNTDANKLVYNSGTDLPANLYQSVTVTTLGKKKSVSPTPSVDSEYIKIPKKYIKIDQKDVKTKEPKKGPPGPSDWTDEDEIKRTLCEYAKFKLMELGVTDPEIDISQKQADPVKELVRQVITDTFTDNINQD